MADASALVSIGLTGKDMGLSAMLGKTQTALGGIGTAVSTPMKVLSGLTDVLGKVGLAGMGLSAVAGAAKGVGDAMGLGVLNTMEQARAGIQAFTKDAAKTEATLELVRQRAAATPFSFSQMATAAGSLQPVMKASGRSLEELISTGEILAASNPLEGLEGASFSLREAMTGDFTSIIERFNLSRSSINQWKAEGVSNFEIVRRAMGEMGFDSDLVAAKAETLEGRWSTFNDSLDAFKAKAAAPAFDLLKDSLMGLQGLFDSNQAAVEAFAAQLAGGLSIAIQTARDAFGTLGQVFAGDWAPDASINPLVNSLGSIAIVVRDTVLPAIGHFVTFVREHFTSIASVIGAVAAGFAAFSVLSSIAGSIAAAAAGFAALQVAIAAAGGVLPVVIALLGGPLTIAIAGIALAVAALTVAWANNWGDIQGKTQVVVGAITTLVEGMLGGLAGLWDTHGAAITAAATTIWTDVERAIATAGARMEALVSAALATIEGFWGEHGMTITTIVQTAWTLIQSVVQLAFQNLAAIFTIGLQLLAGDWQGAWNTFTLMVQNAWTMINTVIVPTALLLLQQLLTVAWQAIQFAATTAWTLITGALQLAWTTITTNLTLWLNAADTGLVSLLNLAWLAIQTGVTTAWTTIALTLQTAWTTITTALTSWLGLGGGEGEDKKAGGLIGLIGQGWTAIQEAVPGAWSAILGVLQTAFGTVTAATQGFLFGGGEGGEAGGVVGMFTGAWAAVSKVTEEVFGGAMAKAIEFMQGVMGVIGDVIGKIGDLVEAFGKLGESIPSWLRGTSPPPLAQWLETIAGSFGTAMSAAQGFGQAVSGALPSGPLSMAGPLVDAARQAALAYGLDPDVFHRMIMQESGFNPTAGSPVGARGIAQFMPGTGAGVAAQLGVSAAEFWASPYLQLQGAARHLRDLYNQFGSYTLALAAYNAGGGAVQKYGGVPPFAETQHYVRVILGDRAFRYDEGGWLMPGLTLAANETGRPEAVLTESQLDRLLNSPRQQIDYKRLGAEIARAIGGGRGDTFNNFGTPWEMVDEVKRALSNQEQRRRMGWT